MGTLKARLEASSQPMESMGGKLISYYLTLGQYDFVAITEAPDAAAAVRALLTIGQQATCARRRWRR